MNRQIQRVELICSILMCNLLGFVQISVGQNDYEGSSSSLSSLRSVTVLRGVARGGSWGARGPPLVGLLLSKQPTIFRWRNRHDNILAVKAIVEKPTFLKFVFGKVFPSTALVLS